MRVHSFDQGANLPQPMQAFAAETADIGSLPRRVPEFIKLGFAFGLGLATMYFGAQRFDVAPPLTCQASPIALAYGSSAEATMTLASGLACSIAIRSAGTAIDELDISQAPQHGTLSLRGRTGVTYRPQRGYTGDDVFVFSVQSNSSDHVGPMVVRVSVKVQ
jgi:hypothetical protein